MRLPALLLLAASAIAFGCSSSSEDIPATNDADYTSARADAPADVPVFTEADAPEEYGARLRVSFGGAAFQEKSGSTSRSTDSADEMPWTLPIGRSPAGRATYAYFGPSNAHSFEVGTYSCADRDAIIFEADWNDDGTARPPRDASACSVIIDKVVRGPSDRYARAYGRFEATGLSSDVRGTFLADFALYE